MASKNLQADADENAAEIAETSFEVPDDGFITENEMQMKMLHHKGPKAPPCFVFVLPSEYVCKAKSTCDTVKQFWEEDLRQKYPKYIYFYSNAGAENFSIFEFSPKKKRFVPYSGERSIVALRQHVVDTIESYMLENHDVDTQEMEQGYSTKGMEEAFGMQQTEEAFDTQEMEKAFDSVKEKVSQLCWS